MVSADFRLLKTFRKEYSFRELRCKDRNSFLIVKCLRDYFCRERGGGISEFKLLNAHCKPTINQEYFTQLHIRLKLKCNSL